MKTAPSILAALIALTVTVRAGDAALVVHSVQLHVTGIADGYSLGAKQSFDENVPVSVSGAWHGIGGSVTAGPSSSRASASVSDRLYASAPSPEPYLYGWGDASAWVNRVGGAVVPGYAYAATSFNCTFTIDTDWMPQFSASAGYNSSSFVRVWSADHSSIVAYVYANGPSYLASLNAGTYELEAVHSQSDYAERPEWQSPFGYVYFVIPSSGPFSLALLGAGLLCARRRRAAQ
jgi:hypothetical protein